MQYTFEWEKHLILSKSIGAVTMSCFRIDMRNTHTWLPGGMDSNGVEIIDLDFCSICVINGRSLF